MPPRVRPRAVCFYCNEEMNIENLKQHTNRNHPDQPIKRKGDPASVLTLIKKPTITKVKPADHKSSPNTPSISVKKTPSSSVKQAVSPKEILVDNSQRKESENLQMKSGIPLKKGISAKTQMILDSFRRKDNVEVENMNVHMGRSEEKPGTSTGTAVSGLTEKRKTANLNLEQTNRQKRFDQWMRKNVPKGVIENVLNSEVRYLSDTARIIEIIKPFSEAIRLTINQLRRSEPLLFDINNPDMIHSSSYQSKIRKDLEPNWVCLRSKADGNCFYESISIALLGSKQYATAIRLAVLHEVVHSKEKLSSLAAYFSTTYDDMLKRTRTLPTIPTEGWADEFIIFVTSEIIKRPIKGYEPSIHGGKGCTVLYASDPGRREAEPVHIMLCHNHFQPLVKLVPEAAPFIPVDDLYNNIMYKYVRPEQPLEIPEHYRRHVAEVQDDAGIVVLDDGTVLFLSKPSPQDKAVKKDDSKNTTGKNVQGEGFSQHEEKELTSNSKKYNVTTGSEQISVEGLSSDVEMKSASDPSSGETEISSEGSGSLRGKVNDIKNKLDDLTSMFHQVLKVQGFIPPSKIPVKKQESQGINLSSIRSIQDLLLKLPFLETKYREEDAEGTEVFTEIFCGFCLDPLDPITKKHGVFKYRSTDGCDFKGTKMSKSFANLKQHIAAHITNPIHLKNSESAEKSSRARMMMIEKNQYAGMILGRAAYMAVKVDHNVAKYEQYAALNSSNKIAIGDINHSRKFARKFGHHAYILLHKRLVEIMGRPLQSTNRPPPFSVIADKYTANRVTGQITGIVTFFDGEIRALNIDFPKVEDHSGFGIAKTLKSSVEKLMNSEQIRTRLVGGCFDGEYGIKGIPGKLSSLLKVHQDAQSWYSWDWDKAHILELAYEQGNAAPLFKQVDETVTLINAKFRRGKAYGDITSAEGSTVMAPITFSTTRFAAYHHRVMHNFHSNFAEFYRYLAEKRDNDLARMDSISFILGFTAKMDLMKSLGELSKEAQAIGLNSWRLYDAIDRKLKELDDMVSSIASADPVDKLTNFKNALAEIRNDKTFHGIDVKVARTYAHLTRSSQVQPDARMETVADAVSYVQSQATIFMQKFHEKFDTTVNKNVSDVADLTRAAFKIENILEHAKNNTVPNEFLTYFHLGVRAGYINEGVTDDEMKEEYRAFSNVVHDLVNDSHQFRKDISMNRYTAVESHVFKIIAGSKSKECMEHTIDLLLSAILRTHCEAAAESMGNIIKSSLGDRRMDFENLKEEVFLDWNGPHPMNADKLIADVLDEIFLGRDNWNFYRKTQNRGTLQNYVTSEVVDRIRKEAKEKSKIPY